LPLVGIKLMRQCEIDFTGKLGVFTAFLLLDVIPQLLALCQKRRGAGRHHYLSVNDAATFAVIMKLVRLVIPYPLTGAIRRRSKHRSPLRPADDLHREMVARHERRFESAPHGCQLFQQFV
jgi:hypothetical protein